MNRSIKIICLVLFCFFVFSCGSKKLVFKKSGVSYDGQKETVVSYQDLRKYYDQKKYEKLYDILSQITNQEKPLDDLFIHFLLFESAVVENKLDNLKSYYEKTRLKNFFMGLVAYNKKKYDLASRYFKINKIKQPIVNYLLGSVYLFQKKYALALGNLILAGKWEDAPWPYLALGSYYQKRKKYTEALKYLKEARDRTYDFENNLINDILVLKAEIYFEQKNYKEALFHAREVFKRDHEKALKYSDPGDILLASGKVKQARFFWEKVLADYSEMPQATRDFILNKIQVIKIINEE